MFVALRRPVRGQAQGTRAFVVPNLSRCVDILPMAVVDIVAKHLLAAVGFEPTPPKRLVP